MKVNVIIYELIMKRLFTDKELITILKNMTDEFEREMLKSERRKV